jgi:hypothetical protein
MRDKYAADPEKYKAIARKSHWNNREKRLARNRFDGQRIKQEVFKHYGNGSCSCCGESISKFLTLDHINGGGNKHRKQAGTGGYGIYRWLRNNGFPEGYQVLCFNCNCARALNNGVCPHKEKDQINSHAA